MRIIRYGLALGLLTGLGACSDMMGGGSHASHATAMTAPTVSPDMVKQVQSKLRDDGYYKQGPVDGVWGSQTEASVRSFQHDHDLTENGQLDVPTLKALNVVSGPNTNTAANNPPPTNNSAAPNNPAATNNPTPAQLSNNPPPDTNAPAQQH